jgi:hypothetical protein
LICIYENDISDTPEMITSGVLYSKYRAEERSWLNALLHRVYPRTYMLVRKTKKRLRSSKDDRSDFPGKVERKASSMGIAPERIKAWKASLSPEHVNAVNRGEFNGAILSLPLLHPYNKTDSIDINTPRAERKYKAMLIPLEEMLSVARQEGIRVGIVYIPSRLQYEPRSHDSTNPRVRAGMEIRGQWLSGRSEAQERIARWCEAQEVPCLDLLATLREQSGVEEDLTYELDSHWNSRGHKIAADGMAAWIEETQVFFGDIGPISTRGTHRSGFASTDAD